MTQLHNSVRLGLIIVSSHSYSQDSTLIGVYKMARRKNNSNAKKLRNQKTAKPSPIDLEIEKIRSRTTIIQGLINFFSVLTMEIVRLFIAYQDFILQLFS